QAGVPLVLLLQSLDQHDVSRRRRASDCETLAIARPVRVGNQRIVAEVRDLAQEFPFQRFGPEILRGAYPVNEPCAVGGPSTDAWARRQESQRRAVGQVAHRKDGAALIVLRCELYGLAVRGQSGSCRESVGQLGGPADVD